MRGRYKSRAYVSTHALRGEKERNPDTTLTSDHDGLNCPPRSGIQLVLHRPPTSGPASLESRRATLPTPARGPAGVFFGAVFGEPILFNGAASADTAKSSQERTIECFRGYAACVEGAKEKGVIYATGVYQKGEIKNSPALKKAYKMGLSVK